MLNKDCESQGKNPFKSENDHDAAISRDVGGDVSKQLITISIIVKEVSPEGKISYKNNFLLYAFSGKAPGGHCRLTSTSDFKSCNYVTYWPVAIETYMIRFQ